MPCRVSKCLVKLEFPSLLPTPDNDGLNKYYYRRSFFYILHSAKNGDSVVERKFPNTPPLVIEQVITSVFMQKCFEKRKHPCFYHNGLVRIPTCKIVCLVQDCRNSSALITRLLQSLSTETETWNHQYNYEICIKKQIYVILSSLPCLLMGNSHGIQRHWYIGVLECKKSAPDQLATCNGICHIAVTPSERTYVWNRR